MQKPVTIVREELRRDIINAINEANLPAFVVGDMLEKLLYECRQLEHQQYEQDKANYDAEVKENNPANSL